MLKVIFMLECNHCHEPYHQLGVSVDSDYSKWLYESNDLEEYAFDEGWTYCHGEDGRINGIICSYCQMTLHQPPDH